jgi:hypothetical protein
MTDLPRFADHERRARLVARHHLARTASDVDGAVRGVTAMHSSDPVTPYLGLWARIAGFTTDSLDRALYEERTLVRMHAMRRTLFIVPANEVSIFASGAARAVAERERRQLERWLAGEMEEGQVAGWLDDLEDAVEEALGDGAERRTRELTELVPDLATEITMGSGRWATRSALSSRLLFLMALDGRVVRSRPAGTWRSSQYHWTSARAWLGAPLDPPDPESARTEIVRRYLTRHGPATLEDVRWWTGWTVAQARRALARSETIEVRLDDGEVGHVLAGDLEVAPLDGHVVTLLIGLDPTPMGWKRRGWYLCGHGEVLYDRNGNAGPTVWVDGRIVGGWGQRPDGEVIWRLLEDVDAGATAGIAAEAAALTGWLDGVVVTPRFRTPLERELSS